MSSGCVCVCVLLEASAGPGLCSEAAPNASAALGSDLHTSRRGDALAG